MKFEILLFFASAIAFTGCVDIPDYEDIPKIYYNGISQSTELDSNGKKIRENVTIAIDFEDGNGDLGASAEERSSDAFTQLYKKRSGWGYNANYELITAIKQLNGSWTESVLSVDSTKWMPILRPDNKQGAIKGTVDLNSDFVYGNSSVPEQSNLKYVLLTGHYI